MSQDHSHPEPLDIEAARWVARRADGLSAAEAAEFDRWWRADPNRAAAVARAEAAEDRLRGLAAFGDDPAFRALLATSKRQAESLPWTRWVPWAIAASLAVALLVVQATRRPSAAGTRFVTAEHGYQRLMLAGSVVQLNAQTELRAPPGGDAELLRGEASFTVLPGAQEVRVRVGVFSVVAKAGSFAVRRDGGGIALLVTAGSAELRKGNQPGRQVAAGERLRVESTDLAGARIVGIRPEQAQELLGWQAPRAAFSDTRLADAIEQLNLNNWEQFEVRDPALAEVRVSGVFRADVPEDFLRYLAATHRIVGQRVRSPSSSDRREPGAIVIVLRAAP